jgi:hypothetical protein
MKNLRAGACNLKQGDIVIAKVAATNSIGQGDFSQANNLGAVISVEPYKLARP